MTKGYDIIVIGSGPAGSMAAKVAASAGRRVCLIERKPVAGSPVRCGEGIGYRGLTLTLEPRPEWIRTEITCARMVSPSGVRVTVEDVDKSWILDRERMDADLARDAADAGADCLTSTAVTSVTLQDNGRYHCTLVNVNDCQHDHFDTDIDKDRSRRYNNTGVDAGEAPVVILADGVESRLARGLGWDTALRPGDVETCAFARVASPDIDQTACVFYTGRAAAPGGYLWVFPRGGGEANVGLGVIGSRCSPGLPKKILTDFIAREFPAATVSNLHCGGVPVARWTRPLVRHGAMLVGDAARQVNAINGAGIAYALYAGKLAGETAVSAFRPDGSVNHTKLVEYQKTWAKNFGKQQDRSYALKEFIMSTDDAFLDKVANTLSKEDPSKINYKRVFMKTFASRPSLLLKAARLFA